MPLVSSYSYPPKVLPQIIPPAKPEPKAKPKPKRRRHSPTPSSSSTSSSLPTTHTSTSATSSEDMPTRRYRATRRPYRRRRLSVIPTHYPRRRKRTTTTRRRRHSDIDLVDSLPTVRRTVSANRLRSYAPADRELIL